MLLSTAAVVASTATVPTAAADPADRVESVAFRVNRLYHEAEQAAEQYNAARQRADRLHDGIEDLREESARGRQMANRMREGLAALAGAQYRAGGIDPAVALMLSSDPEEYLDKAATWDRINSRQAAQLDELREAQRVLALRRGQAERELTELAEERAELKDRKRAVQQKLATAQRLVESLSERQRARFAARLDERAASRAGRGLGPGLDGAGAGPVGRRASAAVTAARAAVGRPYAWGSAGPGAFDCSGLMVWAYRQAGVALPRTSQEQAYSGQRVPLGQARPGDLVIYRGDASHVGMYVGNGQVVHAPYPGALVRYDPIGMLPVSAVTRPV